jgi:hypothetical protein
VRRTLGGLLVVAAIIAMTWPWALEPTMALGARDMEAGDHMWALWLGLRDGPLVANTSMVGAPGSYTWVIGDPLHIPVFAIGNALAGGGFGLGLVHVFDLSLAAVAAAAWARVLWPDGASAPTLAAIFAVVAPGLGGGLVSGMTEAQPMGATALALLALHQLLAAPSARRAALAALGFGVLPWAGAYPALYGALLAPVVVIGAGRAVPKALPWLLAAALGGLALATPVLFAILVDRGAHLPGATSLTSQVLADPDAPQNRMLGADLIGLGFPLQATASAHVHTAYLGLVGLVLAGAGLASRASRRWLPAVLVLACCALSLGTVLQVGGTVPRVGGAPLLAPAGMLSVAVDALGRAPRWYRMAALGGVLLAPMAAAGVGAVAARLPTVARLPLLAVAVLVVGLDSLVAGPAPWPRPTFDPTPPDGFDTLMARPGAVLEVPKPRFASTLPQRGGRPNARLRHPTLIWQVHHELPLSANPHQAGLTEAPGEALADALLRSAQADATAKVHDVLETAKEADFRWIVMYPGLGNSAVQTSLISTLGPPTVDTLDLLAWELVP